MSDHNIKNQVHFLTIKTEFMTQVEEKNNYLYKEILLSVEFRNLLL